MNFSGVVIVIVINLVNNLIMNVYSFSVYY